jgi:hypothetical protein
MEEEVAALVGIIPECRSGPLIAVPFRLSIMVLACAKLAVSCIRLK